MRYGRAGSALITLTAMLAGAGTANAVTVEVSADPSDVFSPSSVQIRPGDSVVFRNQGGTHNVKFDDGSFTQPGMPSFAAWTVGPKAFPTAGRFLFYCELHGAPGGIGMSGAVNVVPPGGTLPDTTAPRVTSASLRKRGSRKLRLTFRTNEAGTATVKFTRRVGSRRRAVRTVRKSVRAGKVTIDLKRTASGRRLALGRYRAAISVKDKAGNKSRTVNADRRLR